MNDTPDRIEVASPIPKTESNAKLAPIHEKSSFDYEKEMVRKLYELRNEYETFKKEKQFEIDNLHDRLQKLVKVGIKDESHPNQDSFSLLQNFKDQAE